MVFYILGTRPAYGKMLTDTAIHKFEKEKRGKGF